VTSEVKSHNQNLKLSLFCIINWTTKKTFKNLQCRPRF